MKALKDIVVIFLLLVAVPYVVAHSAAKGAMKAGFQPVTIKIVSAEAQQP